MSVGTGTMMIMSMVMSVAQAGMQMMAQSQANARAKREAEYRAAVSRNNAIYYRQLADAERESGEIEANQQRAESRRLQGRQRALLAGMGVQVDKGAALDLVVDTAGVGELDALNIEREFEMRAQGFDQQAVNAEASADLAIMAGENRQGSVLGAGVSAFQGVADKWNAFSKDGGSVGGGGFGTSTPKLSTASVVRSI